VDEGDGLVRGLCQAVVLLVLGCRKDPAEVVLVRQLLASFACEARVAVTREYADRVTSPCVVSRHLLDDLALIFDLDVRVAASVAADPNPNSLTKVSAGQHQHTIYQVHF